MKKTFLLIGLITMSYLVKAQPTFGVHVNGIYASAKAESTEDGQTFKLDYKGRVSWKVGVVAEIPVSETFSFMPQLNFLSKGGKLKQTESFNEAGLNFTIDIRDELSLSYLELPLNLVYNHFSGFFVGGGPSISYGLGGKSKFSFTETATVLGETITDSESGTVNVKFDGESGAADDDRHLNRFEFGATILAGYKLSNGAFINLHYNKGFSNISPEANSTFKNQYFGIGIGYMFGSSSEY